jgi:hypothetical protein
MRTVITNANDTREIVITKNSVDGTYSVHYCFVHNYKFSDTYTERQTDCINRKRFATEKTAIKKANQWLSELN